MKNVFAFVMLCAACGDNIHPETDASVYVEIPPEPDGIKPPDEPTACDAGVPDAPVPPDAPECDDKHVEINDHEHKCSHDQP